MADSNSNSIQQSCICVLAYPGHPTTTITPNKDQLILQVSVTIAAVSRNPTINLKLSPKVHFKTTKAFHHPRRAFLPSTDRALRYDIISDMIGTLDIPFRMENVYWGILNFPEDQTRPKPETVDEIKARLLDVASRCASNSKTGYMDIHIRKVDKLSHEDYQKLIFACDKENNSKRQAPNLNDWIIQNVKDVRFHRITCLGVIHKMALESPEDNKYFGLKSIEIKDEDVDEERCCSICMKGFERGLQAIQMPCSHIFHGFCIFRWIAIRPSCPFCRFELFN